MEMIQNILVGVAVALALLYIYQRFLKKTPASKNSCGPTDCGCK